MDPIVIIGTGLAGYNLAKEIRKLDDAVPLVLVSADAGESYSKPMLSNALSKGKSAAQLVLASAAQMAGQLSATIKTNTIVESIDAQAHTIHTSAGDLHYRQLVLAVGASQRKPSYKGNAVDDVMTVNNLADYARFRESLDSAQHIGIIGPGLIGCEFANDLVSAHKTVTVIGPSNTPLDRLLPQAVGEFVLKQFSSAGILFRLGVSVTSIDKHDSQYQMCFSDGRMLIVDLVLSAIGLQPNITLARDAGARVNQGIVVDRLLQTSLPDIYALGDCMEIEGKVLPFVMPLMNAARVLAKTLTGTETTLSYPAMPVIVKTPVHPIVVSPPAPDAHGEWKIAIDDLGARALYLDRNETLMGFVLTGSKIDEKQSLSRLLPAILA